MRQAFGLIIAWIWFAMPGYARAEATHFHYSFENGAQLACSYYPDGTQAVFYRASDKVEFQAIRRNVKILMPVLQTGDTTKLPDGTTGLIWGKGNAVLLRIADSDGASPRACLVRSDGTFSDVPHAAAFDTVRLRYGQSGDDSYDLITIKHSKSDGSGTYVVRKKDGKTVPVTRTFYDWPADKPPRFENGFVHLDEVRAVSLTHLEREDVREEGRNAARWSGGKIYFRGLGGKESTLNADYGAYKANGTFYHSELVHKGRKFTVLKLNSGGGNAGAGEVFLIRDDGVHVRFAFTSENLTPTVTNGILSLPGAARTLDLDRFEAEATFQSKPPGTYYDAEGKIGDPVAALSLLTDRKAQALRKPRAEFGVLASHDKVIRGIRESVTQSDVGSYAVLGRPGVGKSSLVDTFLQGVEDGRYPDIPRTWRAYNVESSTLEAGVKYTGASASRTSAMTEASKLLPILWIADEFQSVRGSGTHTGKSSDVFQTMKPHLADGTMRMIALTTEPEYNQAMKGDSALRSRFPTGELLPPAEAELLPLLESWARTRQKPVPNRGTAEYEEFLKVLKYAIALSEQLDPIEAQPRKSTKLLDRAYSTLRTEGKWDGVPDVNAIRAAAKVLYKADEALFDRDVLRARLGGMRVAMDEEIVGHEGAKQALEDYLTTAFTGAGEQSAGPKTVLLFAGGKGTGKTRLAETAAKQIGAPYELMEMGNYQTANDVEQFLTDLAGKFRINAFTVILLDEIEKAHPRVQSALLRALNSGEFSARERTGVDSPLVTVSTRNGTFLMTTNAGQAYVKALPDDQEHSERKLREAVQAGGVEEFLLDRVQEVVPFRQLTRAGFKALLARKLDTVVHEQANTGRVLDFGGRDQWLEEMTKLHYDGESRAEISGRDVNRIVQRAVRIPLGRKLLALPRDCTNVYLQIGRND